MFMISALLLSGCSTLPPLAKEELLFTTKIEGEKSYEGSFGDTTVTVDAFRDVGLISVSESTPRKVLFKEVRDGKQTLVLKEVLKLDEIIVSGDTFYETITPEGDVLYMTYDNPNRIWTLKNKAGETLFNGKMAAMLQNNGNELIFAEKRDDGSNAVYYNGKLVWESPEPVVQFLYNPEGSRYAAVVHETNRNHMTVKTSFKEVAGVYQHIHGLMLDGDKVYFLGQKADQVGEWTWYLDGKEKVLPFDVKEVHSVRRDGRELGALMNIPQGWFFMSSGGDENLLGGEPVGLAATDKGWKAVLRNENGFFVYNLSKKRRELETGEISLIPIDGGSDVWIAHRSGEEVHWKVSRGDTEMVVLLKYIAPIFLKGQPYLLGEKASGSVDLYQLNP